MRLRNVEVRNYEMREALENEEPDLIISSKKDCYDFMPMGTICLLKTIKGEEATISVGEYYQSVNSGIVILNEAKGIKMKTNPFLDLTEELLEIIEHRVSELDEMRKIGAKAALIMSAVYFTCKIDAIYKEFPLSIPEVNFLDTMGAQRAVLRLMDEVLAMFRLM